MNIYFAASIRAGRELQPLYAAIVAHLQQVGHTVLTEHVAANTVLDDERDTTELGVYTQDTAWLDVCDVVVAEVTVPSLGVGYEIGYALHQAHKPVLCLCQHGVNLSAMLLGNPDATLRVVFYADLVQALAETDRFLSEMRG